MDTQLRSQIVFHLTGRPEDPRQGETNLAGMRPALFARYRRLEDLRYDFPVVLVDGRGGGVRALSDVVDELLRSITQPGIADEGMRRRVLLVEREIRRRMAKGARGTLTELWDIAVEALADERDAAFRRDVAIARAGLPVDGELADCDDELPERFFRHTWEAAQAEKAERARERIDGLIVRLSEVLRADLMRSPAALKQPALKASMGDAHHGMFDFDAMSRLLSRVDPRGGLGERRRGRIEWALSALKSQRFYPVPVTDRKAAAVAAYEFAFDGAGAALAAFRQRLPALIDLLKALQVAELEVEGAYTERVHDAVVGALDEHNLTPSDLEFFPDYFVCLTGRDSDPGHTTRLADALASGVPLKILVQVGDLFEEPALGLGQFAFGLRGAQLATAAMSMDDVFVLQSSASNLLQLRDRIAYGLSYPGPALFSVYSAPAGGATALPPYLASAAAMQSRAFPAFSYDPGAGPDLASRFSLENNPQPEVDWPVAPLSYADADLQSVTEDVAFTFVDFALCNPRHGKHFSVAPKAAWGEGLVPADRWLTKPPREATDRVPCVLAVDDGDQLCRLVADERLIRVALRCRDAWHRLQELGGIHDSRAERLLAREREAWEKEHRAAQPAPATEAAATAAPGPAPTEPAPASQAAAPAAPAEAEPERNPDEPYIETIRCSTCNECTQINPRMFHYNENKQAYIADLKAGTYKEMVEAAESCQLSIIHPGKPWDPSEPGLEELIERAQPFQ